MSRERNIALTVGLIAIGGFALARSKKKRRAGLRDFGSDRMGEYFTFDEFIKSQRAQEYDIQQQWNPEQWQIENGKKLAQFVGDPVRRQLGGPLIVNSWWRSQELQDLLRELGYPAAVTSRHFSGGAFDVKFNYNGERRNDLLVRAVLVSGVPFDRMLIEHGTVERPSWIQLEYDGNKTPMQQEGKIIRIPSGTSGTVWSREYTEQIYL